MVLEEIKRSLIKTKRITAILLFQFVAGFFIVSLLFQIYFEVERSNQKFKTQYTSKHYYKLVDRLIGDEEKDFNAQADNLTRLKGFYNEFIKSKDFIYLETHAQPILVSKADFKNDKFCSLYEKGRPPYEINIDSEKYIEVKCVTVNADTLDEFEVKTFSGNVFKNEDFIYRKGKIIPVLLGYEYIKYFKNGDILKTNYLSENLLLKVIGFMEKDTSIMVDNLPEYIDRYIILPSFDFPDDPKTGKEKFFQKINYLNKINGTAVTLTDGTEVSFLVNKLCEKYQIPKLIVVGANSTAAEYFYNLSEENMRLLLILAVVIYSFSAISLVLVLLAKFSSNLKTYGVHLICGGTVKQLNLFILGEAVTIVVSAFIIAFLLYKIIFGNFISGINMLLNVFLLVFTIFVSIFPILRKVNKTAVNQLIKREE